MSRLEKYVFGEAGVSNLLFGVIPIVFALVLTLFIYGYLSGMASGEGDIVLTTEGISGFPLVMLLILVLGVVGGYEIGRYVQTQFTKRRKKE